MTSFAPPFEVSCPSCHASFPIDPAKVPDGGIPAICSQCLRVFPVVRPEEEMGAGGLTIPAVTLAEEPPAAGPEVTEGTFASGSLVDEPTVSGDEPLVEEANDLETEPWDSGFGEPAHEVEEPVWDRDESNRGEPHSGPLATDAGADDRDAWEISEGEGTEPSVTLDAAAETETDTEGTSTERQEAGVTGAGIGRDLSPPEPVDEPPVEADPADPRRSSRGPADFEDLTTLATEAFGAPSTPEPEDSPASPSGTVVSGASRFGRRDPSDRARRLARVLVSDIIAYHPERYRRAFEEGTLQEDFRSEIDKSWKEYVDQVGLEMAESTPYFREALDEVLGKGRHRF